MQGLTRRHPQKRLQLAHYLLLGRSELPALRDETRRLQTSLSCFQGRCFSFLCHLGDELRQLIGKVRLFVQKLLALAHGKYSDQRRTCLTFQLVGDLTNFGLRFLNTCRTEVLLQLEPVRDGKSLSDSDFKTSIGKAAIVLHPGFQQRVFKSACLPQSAHCLLDREPRCLQIRILGSDPVADA
ncbi:hypothetical protein Hsar01_03156 [Haloferula sargassicola]|uniref:Transposase n=1 Tax=Haloferula sargassicola TaxID=490096 RepID=A0ABP9UX44_9BACT